jgi:hypothetical protein
MKTVKELRECIYKGLKEANENRLLVKGPEAPDKPVKVPPPVPDETTLDKVSSKACEEIVAYEVTIKIGRDSPIGSLAVNVEGLDELIKAITGLKKS